VVLYLDTSVLVKLYVEEDRSAAFQALVNSSAVAATSLISYAEARAAFARRFREKAFTPREYRGLTASFEKDWGNYLRIRASEALVKRAGDLAEKHGLRGLDAIHLASALLLAEELSSAVLFASSDQRLQEASRREKLAQP
jgi:predicted nucleic acid-binding protein